MCVCVCVRALPRFTDGRRDFSSRSRELLVSRAPIECPYSSESATSAQTFIARESIATGGRNTVNGVDGERDAPGKKAKFIREIIYRDGILRGVQPRREGRKERKKERCEWLIFGVRGRPHLSCGAKECLAFDLCSLLKVADAQTSSWHKPDCSRTFRQARSYKDTFWYGRKIQNQRGILLTIYVGVSSALYPGSVKDAFTTENI